MDAIRLRFGGKLDFLGGSGTYSANVLTLVHTHYPIAPDVQCGLASCAQDGIVVTIMAAYLTILDLVGK